MGKNVLNELAEQTGYSTDDVERALCKHPDAVAALVASTSEPPVAQHLMPQLREARDAFEGAGRRLFNAIRAAHTRERARRKAEAERQRRAEQERREREERQRREMIDLGHKLLGDETASEKG